MTAVSELVKSMRQAKHCIDSTRLKLNTDKTEFTYILESKPKETSVMLLVVQQMKTL